MLCSRCKKRMAVVFITRMEGDKSINEGLCIKCAKEMNIKPVTDLLDKMGITDEQLDAMDDQMAGLMDTFGDSFDMGGAQSMPFMQMFNMPQMGMDGEDEDAALDFYNQDEMSDEEDSQSSQTEKKMSSREKKERDREKKKYKFLSAHCENLTQKAKDGKIDRIVGRDQEIERVIQILNRRTKNNPCLIGEPGVGKTAIAEGIAQKLADGTVPAMLQGKELYLLDMTSLVAGTQFRGQFESRVKGLLDDVRKIGNAILFIDEVHSLVGAGDSEGSMNAANILKPALSRGEIQVIGATTFDEYRKHIEKDAALERRFQPVKVDQPTIEQTVDVLKGIKKYYEQFHRVTVTDEIARRAVLYSERYINDRFLPDKAIDLLDEACSCANLRNKTLAQYDEYNRQIKVYQHVIESEEQKDKDVDYEKLAENKAKVLQLQSQAKELESEALGQKVTDEDLAKVIELWTGIPASKIQESEMQRVSSLEESLKKRIIGQDEAVKLVSAAVRRSRVQISKKRRPASFIFVGPTGVGKTELVKVLSEELFDKQNPLIRLDMSEFMEKHSVARIIGAPPGYVGYDEAGQLTEKVRRRPYSVVLFDEIEKAHPDVMNILLQILDEGKITDAQGRIVSFESTVIVMTSNCGTEQRASSLGFNKTPSDIVRDRVMQSLSEFLRPEFLGRVDEVVIFNQLTEEDFVKIAELMLGELKEPLAEKGITCLWDEAALKLIAHKAHGKQGGARDLRRLIRKEVEDKICSLLVERYANQPAGIQISAEDDNIVLHVLD
ncbi:ATP-dependent Clp protease ATP-binding subunit [Negativibacillus massiliensis]|uniref:ATP-dependent Clp protease ATP-binding subunit n=1 Tax=Negativibacillus massiliensis TaxID=1871035 RepID=UPI00097692FC|nr:ATP-dependent Clp protease ATP-binding subunit [Negativibacillus massiliensis]MCI6347017.1 ATP-dependent Clp protease ATP-binding subunit [Negativibacillus massiliensis]MDY4048126.1 ATP-dependent Clp protease ATP-binding subunit [Negativibacillus massiliensis]